MVAAKRSRAASTAAIDAPVHPRLLADAVAPFAGIAATRLFALPGHRFGVVLALFAGFFLYIGASDLIPESYHVHPQFMTTLLTLLSAALLYLAVVLVNH